MFHENVYWELLKRPFRYLLPIFLSTHPNGLVLKITESPLGRVNLKIIAFYQHSQTDPDLYKERQPERKVLLSDE